MSVAVLAARSASTVDLTALEADLAAPSFGAFGSAVDVDVLGAQLRDAIGFPVPLDQHHGGRIYELLVTPGTLAVRVQDRHGLSTGDPDADADALPGAETLRLEEQGVLFRDEVDTPRRDVIREWSRDSRARMVRALAELDYSGWHRDGGNLCMVTLTLPGQWEVYAPTGEAWKGLVDALRLRWRHEVRTPWRCVWKLEFQRRGAPHQHMLMRVPAMVGGQKFETWLSETWADVCRSSLEPQTAQLMDELGETDRHRRAGTALDWSGIRFSDPRRTSVYFLKHAAPGGKGSKEYQHIVPDLWRAEGAGPGRFWGYSGLRRAQAVVRLDPATWHRAKRILRRVAASRAARVELAAAHHLEGPAARAALLGMRRRRARSLTVGGGWVLLNDALSAGLDLGRALLL